MNNTKLLLTLSLIVSLCLNAYLILILSDLKSNHERLQEEFLRLTITNENLTSQVHNLRNLLEIVERQLSYYRNQTEYYSRIGHDTGILRGEAKANVVAVKMISSNLFETLYEGTTLKALIELRDGKGRILVDTEPRIGIDLQTSARTAVKVAQEYTGVNLSKVDVIITIIGREEVEVMDGPSAGLPITAAIIAAVRGEKISERIYATGTIYEDGSVGPVGGILEKALAAAQEGASLFMVPKGQSMITIYEKKISEPIRGLRIIRYVPKIISLESYLETQGFKIKVIEVSSISEAYALFLGGFA